MRTYPHTLKCPITLMHHVLINKYCIYFAGIAFICDAGTIKQSDIFCQEWLNSHNYPGSRWLERREGVVPMSGVNFHTYPFSLSFKVLDKYYLIPLKKGPMT